MPDRSGAGLVRGACGLEPALGIGPVFLSGPLSNWRPPGDYLGLDVGVGEDARSLEKSL